MEKTCKWCNDITNNKEFCCDECDYLYARDMINSYNNYCFLAASFGVSLDDVIKSIKSNSKIVTSKVISRLQG